MGLIILFIPTLLIVRINYMKLHIKINKNL